MTDSTQVVIEEGDVPGLTDSVDRLIDRAVAEGHVETDRAAGLHETVNSGGPGRAFDVLVSHLDDTDARLSPEDFAHVVLIAYRLGVFTEPDPAVAENDVGAQRILRATIDRLNEGVDYDG